MRKINIIITANCWLPLKTASVADREAARLVRERESERERERVKNSEGTAPSINAPLYAAQ